MDTLDRGQKIQLELERLIEENRSLMLTIYRLKAEIERLKRETHAETNDGK